MVSEKSHVNKFLILGVLGLFLMSFMGSFVVADAEDVGEIVGETFGQFGEGLKGFFTGLFGDTLLGEGVLGNIFMALLIGMFVYSVLGTFFSDQNPWILNLATIAATGLAILGLPENFLKSILINFGAMGGAILMIVPFLVIFWFTIKVNNVLMARGIWLFYTAYYFIFFFGGLFSEGEVWLSFWAMALGWIMFFSILKVRKLIFKEQLVSDVEEAKKNMENNLAAKDISEEIWRGTSGIGKGK
ncbi:hypothetical protein KAJ38_02775 [Candidatus Pacearchaeota archaeon]|nr:hypothetical protein [Candidatus Pacearchaeota archaeon]